MSTNKLSFDNTEIAFKYKNDTQLKKAKILFGMMGTPWLVNMGIKLTPWAIKSGLPVKGIIRSTIFEQFVGGETMEATAKVGQTLGKYNVDVILDYGVEGSDADEATFDKARDQFIKVIDYAATQPNIPFMSVKVTGLTRFALLEKVDALMAAEQGTLIKKYLQAIEKLEGKDKTDWHNLRTRLLRICERAQEKNVKVLIDAEDSWIQESIDALVTLMMDSFNKEKAIIYNTAQLYRHDRLQFVKNCYDAAKERGFIFAIKLVRGAYMEKERDRAAEKGYPSPIQPDKYATDKDFDAAVDFCLDRLDAIAPLIASHNELSNYKAVEKMEKLGVALNHPHVHFSQLYGMSDNITFNLALHGCSVSKYLPFGPIEEVIPYLMRRAQENTSVKGQTGRELGLIEKELKRRK